MANPQLSQNQIEEKLKGQNLEEWQQLWRASQGGAANWELMAAALPFSESKELSVLDLCCGPGDIGRYISQRFGKARVQCVDVAVRRAEPKGRNLNSNVRSGHVVCGLVRRTVARL
jgi:ubiquinone/menaquinone biosynthesis C-methylase UbiE